MAVTLQQKQRYFDAVQQSNACVHRSKQVSIKEELSALERYTPTDANRDTYGRGGIAEEFEAQLSSFFGKPGVVFLPTGTLAQNVAMKCYSEKTGKKAVALHPTSHLLLHEYDAIETLWQLRVKKVGQSESVLSPDDLHTLDASDICAIIIETPMRELGGVMPEWGALLAMRRWCDANQVAMHLDGARLWQTTSFYQRSVKQIAEIFDSVYVSFYKDLNGIAGAALLGEATLIEDARIWARRAGGNPITLYPDILAAKRGLHTMNNRMPGFVDYTKELARQLSDAGFSIIPEIPQAAMFHLQLHQSAQTVVDKVIDYARRTGVVVLPLPRHEDKVGCICEISIGDQAIQFAPGFWAEHLAACLNRKQVT